MQFVWSWQITVANYKQLVDEAEHDQEFSRPEVWVILDIIRKPNPIIVLLYIHTKMQAKSGKKRLMRLILQNEIYLNVG